MLIFYLVSFSFGGISFMIINFIKAEDNDRIKMADCRLFYVILHRKDICTIWRFYIRFYLRITSTK